KETASGRWGRSPWPRRAADPRQTDTCRPGSDRERNSACRSRYWLRGTRGAILQFSIKILQRRLLSQVADPDSPSSFEKQQQVGEQMFAPPTVRQMRIAGR